MQIARETDAAALTRLYDAVLRASFPDTELVPRDEFLREVGSGALEVLVATVEGSIVGTVVGERHGSAVLVAWLAVAPDARSGGVGGALLDAGVAHWSDAEGVDLVLAEVERPDVFPVHPAHGDPARRLAFYGRHGAVALDIPYAQPPVGDGAPWIPGMLLLALAGDAPLDAPRSATPAERTAVGALLRGTCGESSDDAARTIIAAASAPELWLLPLDDYPRIPVLELDAS